MTDHEIIKFINKCFDKRFKDFKKGYLRRLENLETDIRRRLSSEYGNVLNTYKVMNLKLDNMEKLTQSNQIGSHNVYNELKKLIEEST